MHRIYSYRANTYEISSYGLMHPLWDKFEVWLNLFKTTSLEITSLGMTSYGRPSYRITFLGQHPYNF